MVHFKHSGKRCKTRHALAKSARQRGFPSVNKMTQQFKDGQKVHIKIDPSVHHGMPHRRMHGKTGHVIGKRGGSYLVSVTEIDATKTIIAHPAHLSPQK